MLVASILTVSGFSVISIVTNQSAWAGTFPGVNGQIAFVSNRGIGNSEIYVMNADGTGQTNLSNNPHDDSDPTWSPDGSKLAFTSSRDGGAVQVFVMNSDGTDQTQLTNNSANRDPTWSPDGSKLAFTSSRDTGAGQIYVMNADGTGQTNLSNNVDYDQQPSWSPDGSKIAFSSYRNGAGNIYVMNSDGTGQARLTGNASGNADPSWSPDGTKIAFISNRDGLNQIWVMNADGTNPTQLTNYITDGISSADSPTWSPDGTKIVFGGSADNQQIWVMNADGTGQTEMTNNIALDYAPDWGVQTAHLPGGFPAPTTIIIDSDTIISDNMTIGPETTLKIGNEIQYITVTIENATIINNGIIDLVGESGSVRLLVNSGTIVNNGYFHNGGRIRNIGGAINNFGTYGGSEDSELENGSIFKNYGSAGGHLYNTGEFINYGTIYIEPETSGLGNNPGGHMINAKNGTIINDNSISNYGPSEFDNFGKIENHSILRNTPRGIFSNFGIIDNYGSIYNDATINNECTGTIKNIEYVVSDRTNVGTISGNPAIDACESKDTIVAEKDSFIRKVGHDINDGANSVLEVRKYPKRTLIAFDQEQIDHASSGKYLDKAFLWLNINSNDNNWGDGREISLHRITNNWVEGNGHLTYNGVRGTGSGVTWNCAIDTNITNSITNCNNPWDGGSYEYEPSARYLITNGLTGWIYFDVTSDVAAFLEDTDNFGWLLKNDDEEQTGRLQFDSREALSNQPFLELSYSNSDG